MKQQDLAIVAVIVIVVGCASFFLSSKFITPTSNKVTAETVPAISADFTVPDSKYFNSDAINPTVRIQIGPTDNDSPFTGGGDGSGQF